MLYLFISLILILPHNHSIEIPTGIPYPVIYTDRGYTPDFLEVPIGAQIAWIDLSSYPMWTASDPHPLHTDYGLFDARLAYHFGEVFQFSFPDTGTYAYHNHEKSNHRGIIRIYDPEHPLAPIDKTKESLKKTRDKYLAMLDPRDGTSISHMIRTLESDARLSRDCHDMAHDLGHRAYELYGFSRAMTWSNGTIENTSVDDICAGGYMHGILEELFLHHPELQKNPESVCANIPKNHQGSCYHGVGHGVMFAMKRNIPHSLESCRTISTGEFVYRCYEGVWMEMFWGDTGHAGADSLGWDLDDPFGRCKVANADEKPTCFLYAHLGYLRQHPGDYTGVVRFCTGADLSAFDQRFCLKGVGITMMKHFTSHHLKESEQLVRHLSPLQKSSYYEGIIGYSFLSSVSRSDLTLFCRGLTTDGLLCQQVLDNSKE